MWMGSVIQTVAFPVLFIPYVFFLSFTPGGNEIENENESPSYSVPLLCTMYLVLGVIFAGANVLYSVGISYLSASTFALISTAQIGFISIFSYFINHQKMTILIINSIVILALSSSLIPVNSNSDNPSGVSHAKYFLGIFSTLASCALYALEFSLTQLTFEKVRKKHTYSIVLELILWTCFIATIVTLIGFFASGQWRTITEEMHNFETGRVSYVMTLIGISISWTFCSVGQTGLVFVVSSLFCNVIIVVSFAVVPISAVIFFHDKMDGVKIIVMLMAFWGLLTYLYQHYSDDAVDRRTVRVGTRLETSMI